MSTRLDFNRHRASGMAGALFTMGQEVAKSGLDQRLFELVKIRASQINGCAYCLDMHWKDAKAIGESDQRLYMLPAWREAPCYSEQERAALAWTEAVTLIADGNAPDDVYEEARAHFSERELVDLTMAIVTINSWNRLMVAFREEAGTYQPEGHGE
jgi:AhpD family alkylhydroperoxidase